ncbi:PF11367 family protein [Bordetella bronchiseptica 345]|nr:PF11367 family protein [Bordetella bronchiseptica 345]
MNLSSVPKSDVGVVQIDCYAGPGGSAESLVERLATAARDALDAAGIVNRISFSTREPDTELFRISLQADFIRNR